MEMDTGKDWPFSTSPNETNRTNKESPIAKQGMIVKEFQSQEEAMLALKRSKDKIAQVMEKARQSHLNNFQDAVEKNAVQDKRVCNMPLIRISLGKSLTRDAYGKNKQSHKRLPTLI